MREMGGQSVACPHCHKKIEIVSASDLETDFDINSNKLTHEREMGRFPDPWIKLNNRHLWLRGEIEDFLADSATRRVSDAVSMINAELSRLSKSERDKARKLIERGLESNGEMPKPRRNNRGRRAKT